MQKVIKYIFNKKSIILTIMLITILSIALQNGDPDIFWHIKNGEWIVNNGIPTKDPFSYWDTGFISQEWLFDIFAYFIYSIFGYYGITIIPCIIFGIALYLCASSQKTSNYLPLIFMLIMFAKNPVITIMRPHVVSFLLFAITMFLLIKNKFLWIIPLISLLCVNMHGGISVIILIIYTIHQIAYLYENYKNYNKKDILYRLLIFILIIISLACNPYGLEILIYGFKTPPLSNESLPTISSSKDIVTLFVILLPAACMAFTKKRKLVDILMIFMSVMASLIWIRMIGFYILVFSAHGIPYVAETIELVYDKFFTKNKIMSKIKTISSIVLVSLAIFSIVFTIYAAISLPEDKMDSYSDITAKPILEYIKENNIDVENNIMFNHYNFGGYFIFNDIPVFIDGRCEPYLEEFGNKPIMNDYFHMIDFGENTIELLKEYDVKYIAAYDYSKIVKGLQEINAVKTLVCENGVVLLEIINLGGVSKWAENKKESTWQQQQLLF